MAKTICIIHHESLTEYVKRNFFIDDFRERGHTVVFCDISYLLGYKLDLPKSSETYCYIPRTLCETNSFIDENRGAFYILEFLPTKISIQIISYLMASNCIISKLGIFTAINLTTREKIKYLSSYGYRKIFNYCTHTLFNGGFREKTRIQYDVFFYCGEASRVQLKANRVVAINSFDYDENIQGSEIVSIDSPYAIFLDQYLPFHPDVLIDGGIPPTPDKYYSSLNTFFDNIEKAFGLKVIIAAHPKSEYSQNVFEGRKIVKYKTQQLVKASSLVIAHDSLSLSFAVLNYKPIYLIYTKEIQKMGRSTMALLHKFSEILSAPLYNIDNEISLTYPLVNKVGYDNYKYLYLTSKISEHKTTIDILCETIDKY